MTIILSHQCPGQHVVRLLQTVNGKFAVEYGKHYRNGMSYGQAAKELGECIMHAACCASLIRGNDNV